ncbi:MAG: hypothetical protein KAR20_24375, partial [Candidatus Heimdallarchaeota archaeon]|nr:hypothetical protein [Candidatus Heimdallarchaeota archaeon]
MNSYQDLKSLMTFYEINQKILNETRSTLLIDRLEIESPLLNEFITEYQKIGGSQSDYVDGFKIKFNYQEESIEGVLSFTSSGMEFYIDELEINVDINEISDNEEMQEFFSSLKDAKQTPLENMILLNFLSYLETSNQTDLMKLVLSFELNKHRIENTLLESFTLSAEKVQLVFFFESKNLKNWLDNLPADLVGSQLLPHQSFCYVLVGTFDGKIEGPNLLVTGL